MERRIKKRKFMLELKMGVLRYVLVNVISLFYKPNYSVNYFMKNALFLILYD